MRKRIIAMSIVILFIIGGVLLININLHSLRDEKTGNDEPTIGEITENYQDVKSDLIEEVESTIATSTTNVIVKDEKKTIETTTPKTNSNKTLSNEDKKETKPATEQVTNKTAAWEKLGVTEDEYYNNPIYKWEKVDFSVDDYGSEKKAREACLKYGDNYEPYLNGEVSFNCDSVSSLSGRYLGEMFHTEKLS